MTLTQQEQHEHDQIRKSFNKNITIGLFICVLGITITAISYFAAASGGTYIVAWGAIIFGAAQFIYGLTRSA